MGQYWKLVNLDKKEFVDHYKVGCGAKLWEQLANNGTGQAMVILCAAMPEARGGGDFDLDENWHGPERTFPEYNAKPAPMPEDYQTIAARTIGRWAGDRIALVGDYAEDTDLLKKFKASKIWDQCSPTTKQVYTKNRTGGYEFELCDMSEGKHQGMFYHYEEVAPAKYTDISDDVAKVIEHELNGKFVGDSGWKHWEENVEEETA